MESTQDTTTGGRRIRMTTLQEQQEFTRVAKQLREAGVGEEELQRELGYENVEALHAAVENGRVTAARFQKLQDLALARLPDIVQQKTEASQERSAERMQKLLERFRSEASEATAAAAGSSGPGAGPEATSGAAGGGAASRGRRGGGRKGKNPAAGRKKEFLTSKQHARLRDQIEHLWAVDKRFRNWSLLAKVGGLSSGQAIKRAYEVNSSMATLQNVETFARLHAGFGSRATAALKEGVPVEELQAHLTGRAPNGGAQNGGAQGGNGNGGAGANGGNGSANRTAGRAPGGAARTGHAGPQGDTPAERALSVADLPETPPSVDFESLVELGQAIDVEVQRMWLTARFFDGVANLEALPRTVRNSATQTRDHLLKGIAFFADPVE